MISDNYRDRPFESNMIAFGGRLNQTPERETSEQLADDTSLRRRRALIEREAKES